MKQIHFIHGLLIFSIFLFGCNLNDASKDTGWELLPFIKVDSLNPIMGAKSQTDFYCPIREEVVFWESKDVFNPSAIVKDDKVYMLYRAEDKVGKYNGTSRIGIAVSNDGLLFERDSLPVFYPENDSFKYLEWEGGCEDPRIIEDENGNFYMTYSAYDGNTARLLIASSKDLYKWQKHGSVFKNHEEGKFVNLWSKSGSIVSRIENGHTIATKIKGKYWMYFGDTDLFIAWSTDLINWIPIEGESGLLPVLQPRKYMFDSGLVEPGPPALITSQGILLIYNSRNDEVNGDSILPSGTYTAGQALFDKNNPAQLIKRSENYFFKPDKPYEITGQVNNVCFVEGLVNFKGKWFLYYGTADSKIAVATSETEIN